jgi:glycosyltransferase involved in cell wall biosynthesis
MAMMRIGIDARSLAAGPSGVRTYVTELLRFIPCLDPFQARVPSNNFLWNQTRPLLAKRSRGWSAYHASAYTSPLIGCRPLILTVHDICYLAEPDSYPYHLDPIRRWFYVESLRRADRIVVPSDFTRAELLRLHPELAERVRRIYLGVSEEFYTDAEAAEQVRKDLRLPERFLLHVGNLHRRRNPHLIARAAERAGLPLVLVGAILPGGEAFSAWPFRFSGLSQDQLRGLYSAATAFVYASRYEGFGLPVLEAMACGLPVVAARTSCIPEICGDAVVLVEPEINCLVAGINQALTHSERYSRAGLKRAGEFSWKNTALATEQVYGELVAKA